MSGGAPSGFSEFANKAQQPTMSAPAGFSEFATKAQQPTNLTIEQLDAQEQRNRPGLLTGVLQAGKGAINEVGNIAKVGGAIGGFAAKSLFSYGSSDSPANVMTNRVIKGLYKKAHEEFKKSSPQIIYDTLGGLYDVLGNVASETGKSIGIDNSRPGPNTAEVKLGQNTYGFKMDRDVAIQKWTTKPLSAAFDLAIIKDVYLGIAKGAIKGVAKENAEKAVFDALKNNGDNMSDMINAIKFPEGATMAKETSVPGGAVAFPGSLSPQAPILSPDELFKSGEAAGSAKAAADAGETPFEKLFKHRKIITQDITRKQLNDPGWADSRSRELSRVLIDISKAENKHLDSIIEPIKNKNINIDEINSRLITAKNEALTPESEVALNKYINKFVGKNESITIGEAREEIRRIDNQVYGTGGGKKIDFSENDKALMSVRGILRDSISNSSPAYDKVAKGISNRIKILGGIEGNLLKAEGTVLGQTTASNIGFKIVETPASMATFQSLLKDLGDSTITAKSAGEASKLIETIDAAKAWNNYFGKNESIFSGSIRDTAKNTKFPFLPESIVRPVNEMMTMGRLDPNFSGAINAVGKAGKASLPVAKKAVKSIPFASRVLDM